MRVHARVGQQRSKDGAVLDAEAGAGAVMGGCGVGRVAGDGQAVAVVGWDGVEGEVVDGPLRCMLA